MKAGIVKGLFGALALIFASLIGAPLRAETGQVTLARQFGIGYLPLTVMQAHGLVQKHLAEAGLKKTEVIWLRFGSGSAANDGLLSGQLNFASGGTAPALILWDKTHANAKVRGVAALSSMPNLLLSINPQLKSLEDFTEKDRIAMAGAGSSVQTVYLQMAAAKQWGMDKFKKLNDLMVNLPHPEGLNVMLSASGAIQSTFTTPPFQNIALKHPKVHIVLNSYDIMGGPNTFLMMWATERFRRENPQTYKAVLAALREATDWINAHSHEAAEVYVQDAGGKESLEEVEEIIRDPQTHFTLAPQRILSYAQFMNDTGTLKNRPASWTDLFFPDIHDLKGS